MVQTIARVYAEEIPPMISRYMTALSGKFCAFQIMGNADALRAIRSAFLMQVQVAYR
jgi:hypothetical protein